MKYERYLLQKVVLGTEIMIEKEDLIVCKTLSKVRVTVFFFSSTCQRQMSYCHGIVSVRSSVRVFVRP